MPFYVYAWIGSFVSGFFVVTAKLTSKHSISNPWLFNFLLSMVTLLFTIPPALANNATIPSDWVSVFLAALFLTLFNIFWIFATYALDISTLTPLFSFRGIFAVLIGVLFFNETFQMNQLVFIALIIVAGVFTSLDEKFKIKSFFRWDVFLGIATALMLAVYNSFIKVSVMNNGLWSTNLWSVVLSAALVIPTIPLFVKEFKKMNSGHIMPIALMGVLDTVSRFSANIAYGANLAISSLIMNTPFSMVLAFMFSIFAPKLLEKHTLKIYAIRFGATAVMIWSAMQLTK